MSLQGKKILIPIEDMYNDLEFWYPYYRLIEAGAEVVVVGSGRKATFDGKAGTDKAVDVNADGISATDYDGIVIPGGYAPDLMRRYPAMVQLVRDLYQDGKLVASICHAGWMLASAKVRPASNTQFWTWISPEQLVWSRSTGPRKRQFSTRMLSSDSPDKLTRP